MVDAFQASGIILDLYRGAQNLSIAAFPTFAIRTVQRLVDFDMAMFGLMTANPTGDIAAHYFHVFNEPHSVTDEWVAISGRDLILQAIIGNLGQGAHFHVPALFKARQDAQVRDYAQRRRHANVLAMALPYGRGAVRYAISLRRADPCWGYTDRDRRTLELIIPHVAEALRINRAAFSRELRQACTDLDGGFCIVDDSGLIVYQDAGFSPLARQLFVDFEDFRLPARLYQGLREGVPSVLRFGAMRVLITKHARLHWVSIRRQGRLDTLTDREKVIARYYGTGLTHKEIGAELSISPATARRHVEAIYLKLRVRTKADLAFLVHADAAALAGDKSLSVLVAAACTTPIGQLPDSPGEATPIPLGLSICPEPFNPPSDPS